MYCIVRLRQSFVNSTCEVKMSKILKATDGFTPNLYEVENPCIQAELEAIYIGSLDLLIKRAEVLINSFELHGSELSVRDFKTFVEHACRYIADPVMVLASDQIVGFRTYEEGKNWFQSAQDQPETIPEKKRKDIVYSLYTNLDEMSHDLHENYHKAFAECEYTVHVTPDSRIVVARYGSESELRKERC